MKALKILNCYYLHKIINIKQNKMKVTKSKLLELSSKVAWWKMNMQKSTAFWYPQNKQLHLKFNWKDIIKKYVEGLILREVKQRKTNTVFFTYIWNLKIKTNEYIQQSRNRLRSEKKIVVNQWWEGWEVGQDRRRELIGTNYYIKGLPLCLSW